jgi:hypothetical protein
LNVFFFPYIQNIGLPIGKPFSFNEDDLMNITCPYCYSDNVSRTTPVKSTNTYGSMAGAGIGTMISKVYLHRCHHYWEDWWEQL